jgi:bifunctional non-homologous end joining protein LigD
MLASKPLAGKSVADYSREEWALEEKFDGHRLILTTRAGENPLAWSRVGNARELPPHLVSSIKTFVPDGTFDGELYLPGGTSTDVKALENAEKLSLVFFDVLRVENANVMDLGGIARRQMLQHVGAKLEHAQGYGNAEGLSVAPQYDPTEENLHMLWNRGGEGGILKRKDAAYEPGKRSKAWLKLKKEGTTRMTVIGFVPGLLGPHAMIQLRDDMGVEITVKSLNDAWRADFAVNADAYVGRRLVIAFQERTRDGKYRHPMAEYFEEER